MSLRNIINDIQIKSRIEHEKKVIGNPFNFQDISYKKDQEQLIKLVKQIYYYPHSKRFLNEFYNYTSNILLFHFNDVCEISEKK